MSYFLG